MEFVAAKKQCWNRLYSSTPVLPCSTIPPNLHSTNILNFWSLPVTIRTTRLYIQKFYIALTLCLQVLYGFQDKNCNFYLIHQQLFFITDVDLKVMCHKSVKHNHIRFRLSKTTCFGPHRPSSGQHYKTCKIRHNTLRLHPQYGIAYALQWWLHCKNSCLQRGTHRVLIQGVQLKSGPLTKPWIFHVRCYL